MLKFVILCKGLYWHRPVSATTVKEFVLKASEMTQQVQVPSQLIIASRESRLAMWQAQHVRDRLAALYPDCQISILGMTTRGDQILDRTLSKVGGKGLFVKELEVAMAEGRADLAVHSLKDVPMELPEGFVLAAVLEREDPRDAFVSNDYASLAREGYQRNAVAYRCVRMVAEAAGTDPAPEPWRTLPKPRREVDPHHRKILALPGHF